jgi:hypothetical protein
MIYEIGHIYMIWDIDDQNLTYYGSTNDFNNRMRQHKDTSNACKSKQIIDRGNYEVAILETYENIDEYDLHERERWYILNKPCINKQIPHRTSAEYYQDNKEKIAEQHKEYRQDNKEKIAEQKKEYYQDNKEKIAEYFQEYRQNNKEKIAEQHKEYYQDNKEKIIKQQKEYYQNNKEKITKQKNEKFVCECGGKYTHNHTARHKKSKKHLKWIQSCKI